MTDFLIFWNLYPADLAQKKKGVKSQAEKAWNKIPEGKRAHVITCLRELIRHARTEQKSVGKTDRWAFASTWLNQERWTTLEDIESYTSLKEKSAARLCECKAPATILNKCDKCHDKNNPHIQMLKELHERERQRTGLAKLKSETKNEYANRCRAAIKSRGMGKALAERTTSNA